MKFRYQFTIIAIFRLFDTNFVARLIFGSKIGTILDDYFFIVAKFFPIENILLKTESRKISMENSHKVVDSNLFVFFLLNLPHSHGHSHGKMTNLFVAHKYLILPPDGTTIIRAESESKFCFDFVWKHS